MDVFASLALTTTGFTAGAEFALLMTLCGGPSVGDVDRGHAWFGAASIITALVTMVPFSVPINRAVRRGRPACRLEGDARPSLRISGLIWAQWGAGTVFDEPGDRTLHSRFSRTRRATEGLGR